MVISCVLRLIQTKTDNYKDYYNNNYNCFCLAFNQAERPGGTLSEADVKKGWIYPVW